jgi:hypothetical protein
VVPVGIIKNQETEIAMCSASQAKERDDGEDEERYFQFHTSIFPSTSKKSIARHSGGRQD